GDIFGLGSNYNGGTQVVVNGTLTATGTTFNQPGGGYFTSLTVNSGGHLTPSGCAFDLPLFLPAGNVQDLGGANSNLRFQDINILAGTLATGQTVALNAIGTDTTKLRYVFPGAFTVAAGATLTVGAGVPLLLQTGQILTDNGAMTLATGDIFGLGSNYNGGKIGGAH